MSVKKLHQYKGQHFGITRNSLHSARVQLICGNHEHEDFLVNLIDESNYHWVSSGSDYANGGVTGLWGEKVRDTLWKAISRVRWSTRRTCC